MINIWKSISVLSARRIPFSNNLRIVRATYCTNSTNDENENENFRKRQDKQKLPAIRSLFENASEKTKSAYLDMVTIFEGRDVHRRNHVEFIYAALRNMEEFGVNKDLEVYKALINVMPKGKFIPTNIFQAEFMHYPKQQQCIIDLLEQMEENGVIPDTEMEQMLLNIFGKRGHPLRKYWRMMYWMPKFKNLSPWPLPDSVPDDILELAKMAVERMCTVDHLSQVEIFDTNEIEDSIDKTWIVSGMSPEQTELLNQHDKSSAIYVEGPFIIWLRHKTINYFVLKSDEVPSKSETATEEEDMDDVSKLRVPFYNCPPVIESKIARKRSVHQQDDGTIFAICASGTSSQDSLLSWIRILQKRKGLSCLNEIPILFKFRSKIKADLVPLLERKS